MKKKIFFFLMGIFCFSFLLLGILVIFKNYFTVSEQISDIALVIPSHVGALFAEKSKSLHWSLLLTGDIIPARVVNQKMVAKKDFMWPLVNIAGVLRDADITLINLEAPLIINCPITSEGFKFCGEADFSGSLAISGVDVANLANNHSLNYGWEGIEKTQKILSQFGIETTGFSASYQPSAFSGQTVPPLLESGGKEGLFNCQKDTSCSSFLVKEIKTDSSTNHEPRTTNLKLGFLGYNAVGQRINRENVQQQIQAADKLVDFLIVSIHWGKEYERLPQPDHSLSPDDPKELSHLFIDWGADLIAGNHPHWYQSLEFVEGKDGKDKLIVYALGNTVFDQEWSLETKRGMLLKLYFNGSDLIKDKMEIIPIGLKDYGQAYLLESPEKEQAIKTFQENSQNF